MGQIIRMQINFIPYYTGPDTKFCIQVLAYAKLINTTIACWDGYTGMSSKLPVFRITG